VFAAPWLADAIKAVPFIASFSCFMDESTMMADLVLPDNSNFESWDLDASLFVAEAGRATPPPSSEQGSMPSSERGSMPGSRAGEPDQATVAPALTTAVTLTRPVLSTAYDTRQTADVLIAIGKQLGEQLGRSLPFASAEEMVRAAAGELQKMPGSVPDAVWQSKQDSGSAQESDAAGQFWNKFFESGVWVATASTASKSQASTAPVRQPAGDYLASASARGPDPEYPLTLLAYEHPALGYGGEANLPWLQELPEPMTTVMWGSWIEINPKTAAAHSIEDGDLVEVRSAAGSLRAPALIYPAIHPELVAIPYGQGHSAYGMFAADRGANAAGLCPVLSRSPAEVETIRVSISRVSGEARLIRFGTTVPERPERSR
jgi:anaerobic selenocysteine-containing dehydrogenase